MTYPLFRFWAALCLLVLLAASCAASDTRYHVRLDASPLAGLGVFNAEFQLTDGSGTGNNNSRVTVENVLLTNGQLGAVLPPTTGNATGDLSGTLVLRDGPGSANALADFAQGFSVANNASPAFLDFDVTLSAAALEPSSSAPDNFVFVLLNSDGSQTLPTNGPTGGETASAAFDQSTPVLTGYSSQTGSVPFLAAPVITLVSPQADAPEPASAVLFFITGVLVAFGAAGLKRRTRQRLR